jgi:DNA-binding PadR family transcriptional regulator
MQEATFLILAALASSAQHGYGIITDVREISGGQVRLGAGTLYTALDRLRRYYALTPYGAQVLAAEAARLKANASAAMSRLNLAGGTA